MKLNDVNNRINEKITVRKWYHRVTAITIVFSLLCAFFVPLDLVQFEWQVSAEGNAFFENVQTEPLGDNLSGKITGVSIISDGKRYDGSPITIPNVIDSPHEFSLSLGYRYDNAQLQDSGILDSHCVYYQIPPGTVNVKQDYFGSGQQVIDSSWSNEQPSGYFSVSKEGLVVIRFTDDYISYLRRSQDGFSGMISFKANVERAETVDGDYTFTLEGQEITFQYPDDKISMTKDGWSNRDENGPYIQWNITIKNPSGHFDLSEFNLTDVITDNGSQTVDLSTLTEVTISPEGAATLSGNGFTLSGNAEQLTISYKQPAQSGHSYNNNATLQKEGGTPIEVQKTVSIENALEANKYGTPDYNIPGKGEGGQILWTINVHNKSGDSLDQTKITDAQFPANKSDISVYYFDNTNQKVALDDSLYELDSANHVLTLNGSSIPGRVYVEYYSGVTGNFVNGQKIVTNSYTIESTKPDNPPKGTDGNPSVTYEHQYTLDKSIAQKNTVNDQIQWKVVATANKNGANSESSATLNGYEITDDAFAGLTYNNNERNGTYISFNAFGANGVENITDQVELVKASADSKKVTVRLKNQSSTTPITRIELFYLKDIEDCITGDTTYQQYKNGEEATVSNSATGEKPGSGQGEGTGPVTGQVQKLVKADKVFLSNTHEKVIGNADKQDRILDWMVNLVNDSGFRGSANAVVDVLNSSNGGQHYIEPAQASALEIVGKTVETEAGTKLSSSYYTVRYYDASGAEIADFANGTVNAAKFEVNFSDDIPTNIRFVTIRYKTTANVSGVPNGSVGENAAKFGNALTYQNKPQTNPGLTFEREDPNNLKYIHFNVQKTWDDNKNKMNVRPAEYKVKIYRAEADADGLAPEVTDTDAWTLVEGSGSTDGVYTFTADQTNAAIPEQGNKDFPEWVVKTENGVETVVRYYYRIEEVVTDAMTEGQYYVSSTSAPILARNDNETFRLTNKKDQDVMKFAIDEKGSEIHEIDLSKVPKAQMSVGGEDTACYIFGWKIYFKEGATKYTDTLPTGAIYLSGSEAGMSKYTPSVIYDDYGNAWNQQNWNVDVTANGSTLNLEVKNLSSKIFKYYTAVPVSQIDAALQGGLLINSVKADGSENEVRASLNVNKDIADDTKHLEKGAIPTIVGGTMKYYIDVNPTAKRLSNDGYVTVTDQISFDASSVLKNNKSLSDLKIALDDVKVYPFVNGVLNKLNPITDYSYTVDYDVTEEKQLSYNKIDDNHWEVQGWSAGDEIEATVIQNGSISVNAHISAMRPDAEAPIDYRASYKKFPEYTDSKSTVSFTVPELIEAAGNKKEPVKVVIYDHGQNNNGNSPYTMTDVESVKSIKRNSAVLNVDVPDQQYVRIEYTYQITGYTPDTSEYTNNPNGDKIYLNNTASFHEDNGDGWDTNDHTELNVKSASATSAANKFPKIYKVDVNNFAVNTLAAKFKVAKYDTESEKWVYASAVTSEQAEGSSAWHRAFIFPSSPDSGYLETQSNNQTYAPDNAAVLEFSAEDNQATANDRENVHEFTLSEGTLYKFVEIEAPEGYTMPSTGGSLEENRDFVFYYAYNGYTGEIPDDAKKDGKSLVRNVPDSGTLNIPNTQPITIQAQKLFTGDDNDLPDSASVSLKLYYSKNRNGTNKQVVTANFVGNTSFANPVTLDYTAQNKEPIATWTGLPSGMGGSPVYYFVEEDSFSITKGEATTTYTYNPDTEKFESDGEACEFQPVYTRNGTNTDGTVIQVNNSEGILVKKSWLDRNGKTIEPAKTENEPNGLAVAFEVYAKKGAYQVKLNLTAEQSTLNPENGYKLFLPQEVTIVEPTSASVKTALGYTEGKTYPLSYFDNYIIEEKLSPEQSEALYGKYGTPKYTAMIDNGTGILELINTDIRSNVVNFEAEKIWDDNNISHTNDSIELTLVQSTSSNLTTDDLIAIAGNESIEKDYVKSTEIRSSRKVLAIAKGSSGSKNLDKAIQSIVPKDGTSQPLPLTCTHNGSEVTVSDAAAAGSYDFIVTFTDGTQQDLKITVFEPTAVLSESNQWQTSWDNLPAVDDSGNSYYYYVIENSVPENYEVSYSRAAGTDTQEVVVTNRLPTTMTIQKEWYEGDKKITNPQTYAGLPNKISVEVYQRYLNEEHTVGEDVPKPDSLKIVALGDSITNGSYENKVAEQYRYWYRLRERLQSDGYSNVSVLNYGVDGNEITDIQNRIANIDFTDVNAVTLLAGTNDVMHGKSVGAAERYKTLVESIYAKAKAANIADFTIYAATIPNITKLEWFQYPDENPSQARADELVANYNSAISDLWDNENTSDNIVVPEGYSLIPVDLNAVVTVTTADHQAVSASETMLVDGCHPNAKGYEAIAKAFNTAINSHYTNATVETVTNPTNVAMPLDSEDNLSALTTGTPYGTYDLLKSNGYTLELKNLPKQDILGNEYVYYVKELGTHVLNGSSFRLTDNTLQYIDSVQYVDNGLTAVTDDSVTIKNKIKTTELHIEKEWSDGNENHVNDEITVRIHRDTIADSAASRQNPLTLTLNRNEVTLYKGSSISLNLIATVPVKAVTDDKCDVTLDASMQHITLAPKSGVDACDHTITFESEDGQTFELTVHIIEKPELRLELDKVSLAGGDAAPTVIGVYTILDDNVKEYAAYESTNPSVIEIVEGTGKMTVKGIGTTTIKANYDGKTATKDVTVNLPESFNIIGNKTVDMTQTIDLDIDKPYGTFTWSSSNDSIAIVDSDGRVTGVAEGTVTITAVRNDGVTATYEVVIQDNTIPIATWNGHSYGNNDLIEFTTADNVELLFNREISSVRSNDTHFITAEKTGPRTVSVGIGPGGVQNYQKDITVTFSDDTTMKLKFNTSEKKPFSVNPTNKQLRFGETVTLTPSNAEGTVTYSIVSQKDSNNQDITGLVSLSGNVVTANSDNITGVAEILVTDGVTEKFVTVTVTSSSSGETQTIITNQNLNGEGKLYYGQEIVAGSVDIKLQGEPGANYQVAICGTMQKDNWGTWRNYPDNSGVSGTLDSNGEATVTISLPNAIYNSEIQAWTYQKNGNHLDKTTLKIASCTVTPAASGTQSNSNQLLNAPKRTRFAASSLRMSTAKLLAAELETVPDQTPIGISPQEQQGMEEHGYFDRTIKDSDNWQITLSELPQYFVKSDGTVAGYYYWVEEISGAEGYKASYSFTDADDYTSYSINAANGGSASVRIKNTLNQLPESVTLPESGSTGTKIYYVFGGILLMLAAAGYTYSKRRRWSDE